VYCFGRLLLALSPASWANDNLSAELLTLHEPGQCPTSKDEMEGQAAMKANSVQMRR
jgi:hypothetical protein